MTEDGIGGAGAENPGPAGREHRPEVPFERRVVGHRSTSIAVSDSRQTASRVMET